MKRQPVPFFDSKDLRPHPEMYRPTLRSRRVCLSPADWQMLGDALQRLYPAGLYLRRANWQEEQSAELPTFQPVRHLCGYLETEGEMPWEIEMCLDPDWKVERWQITDFTGLHWRQNRMPFPFIMVRPGNGIRPASSPPRERPESIGCGEIHVYCEYRNKDHLAFARRFYRLFETFASNRNVAYCSMPDCQPSVVKETGSPDWIGHDARAWALADRRRVFFPMNTDTSAIRPGDDIVRAEQC